MSNLSDLLPAGASAKQITATDSGSGIASKAPVVMSAMVLLVRCRKLLYQRQWVQRLCMGADTTKQCCSINSF